MPKLRSAREIYKEEAKTYESFSKKSFSWLFIEKTSFVKYLSQLLTPRLKVLEIGCGGGRVIEFLISKGIKSENVTGVDVTPELLAIARRKLPRVHFIEGDIAEVKLPSNSYDLVVSNMVFHHLSDDRLANLFKDIYRWLKPGGYFFYVTSHPLNIVNGKLEKYLRRGIVYKLTPWGDNMPHHHRPVSDFINFTLRAGFTTKVVDEPQAAPEGEVFSSKDFKRYSLFPARLVVLAQK